MAKNIIAHSLTSGSHTVGDFSSQAVINTLLSNTFPEDPVVGEEDSTELRIPSNEWLRSRISELVNKALTSPLQEGEQPEWGLGPDGTLSTAQILDMIDRGRYQGGRHGSKYQTPLLSLLVDFS